MPKPAGGPTRCRADADNRYHSFLSRTNTTDSNTRVTGWPSEIHGARNRPFAVMLGQAEQPVEKPAGIDARTWAFEPSHTRTRSASGQTARCPAFDSTRDVALPHLPMRHSPAQKSLQRFVVFRAKRLKRAVEIDGRYPVSRPGPPNRRRARRPRCVAVRVGCARTALRPRAPWTRIRHYAFDLDSDGMVRRSTTTPSRSAPMAKREARITTKSSSATRPSRTARSGRVSSVRPRPAPPPARLRGTGGSSGLATRTTRWTRLRRRCWASRCARGRQQTVAADPTLTAHDAGLHSGTPAVVPGSNLFRLSRSQPDP